MGHLFPITIGIVLLSLFGHSQAACSPCPFQWREHQHHCYQYFPSPLPYGQAEEYCRSQHASRYTGGLAAVDSGEEMLFLINYVGRFINGSYNLNVLKHIRLQKFDTSYENHSMVYYSALNADGESDYYFKPCDTLSSVVEVTFSELGTGTFGMVPAPEVVEQKCAVYAGEGAFLDLGDFGGTCVSDPDVCASETVTWSHWLKIDSRVPFKSRDYYLCSGAYTYLARGVCFIYNGDTGFLLCAARSFRKSWSVVHGFAWSGIPKDTWIHLAATVDLRQAEAELTVYLNGVLLVEDSVQTSAISTTDDCTKLVLGVNTPCPAKPPSSAKAGSAAYSNVMVFDNLLTPEQIYNLYACGNLDWGLKVRSLHFNANSSYSGNLRYVCKASASTGPTIYWRVYHADQAQWEDLGPSSGPGVDITPTSFSTCVVQSVLVIDRSRGPSSEGDIISCTASTGTLNVSVYLQGDPAYYRRSDQDNADYLVIPESGQHYLGVIGMVTEGDLGKYPFICEMERIGKN